MFDWSQRPYFLDMSVVKGPLISVITLDMLDMLNILDMWDILDMCEKLNMFELFTLSYDYSWSVVKGP